MLRVLEIPRRRLLFAFPPNFILRAVLQRGPSSFHFLVHYPYLTLYYTLIFPFVPRPLASPSASG